MATFKAIVIEKADSGTKSALADFDEANLMDGDVTVRVEYSTPFRPPGKACLNSFDSSSFRMSAAGTASCTLS